MGYAIIKNKQTSAPTPELPQYTTVERFVEYAKAMAGSNYKNLEELLADAKKNWAEFVEYEEGKLTDEIVAAASTQLEYFFKKENV
jgi:hypothetical protein